MKLSCCGNFYNSCGSTFEKISRYKVDRKNLIKSYFEGNKTLSETVYVAVCEHCGHYIVKLVRKFENKFKTQKEEYRGKDADNFFYSHYDRFIEMPLQSPYDDIKHKKTIPFIYGKCLDSLTQVPRYIDESDNAGSKFENPIKIYERKKSEKP